MLNLKSSTIQFTLILSLGFMSLLDANTMYVKLTGSDVEDRVSWNTAESLCESSGGELASIHSVAQDVALGDYVYANVLINGWNPGAWIGGYPNSSGSNFDCDSYNFEWTDGTPWDYEAEDFACNDQGT